MSFRAEKNAHKSTATSPGRSASMPDDALPPSYISQSGGSGAAAAAPAGGSHRDEKRGPPDSYDGRRTNGNDYAQATQGPTSSSQYAPGGSASYHTPAAPVARNPFTTQDECVRQSLSRPPAPGPSYASFEPMFLLVEGKNLNKGFPHTPPPSDSHPHPFASHDVNKPDWVGFLTEAKAAGSLTEKDIKHSKIPVISWVPFVNRASAHGVQQFMKSHKGQAVMQVFQKWNHHFFEPRKMQVILMKGHARVPAGKERPSSFDPLPPRAYASIPDESDCRFRLFVVSL
ncbi:unnamed protein product [Cyclocybe aegerita]|uniref:Uncharacterized protein n=1 Tax=Cyclocybe aegerita TaxID=1973307 RepID=A0A8S0XYA9_CYCAE|nr:unnamed protein product [Cyclocybe aegerita]